MIKPFDDLTDPELLAIDDETRRYYVDRECAEAGIKLLPPGGPPVKPDDEAVRDDGTVYAVGGFYFSDPDNARRVAEFVKAVPHRCTREYIHGAGYRHRLEPDDGEVRVGTETCLSRERANSMRERISASEEAKAEYTKAKTEYDTIVISRRDVETRIGGKISEVWHRKRALDRILAEWDRYTVLANGDETIARRFLVAAHEDAKTIAPGLFPDGWDVDAIIGKPTVAPMAAETMAVAPVAVEVPF
jgi:hypothetical protein